MKKPLLRGHIHQESFFVAIGACSMLIARATTSVSLLASVAYSTCLILLFGISALYHRPQWDLRQRAIMRRIDHSAIYLLIAGCFTPVCLLGFPESKGLTLLYIVYGAAFFGILKSIFWTSAPKWLSCILYGVVIFLFMPVAGDLQVSLGFRNMVYIWSGCGLYAIGAVFYALKKPNFFPEVFGHHELFHFFTVVGSILHFLVMYSLIK